MNIYTQTVPYFYIIRNKDTGIMYTGSKWAKGCHPDTFMVPNGYQTSSPTIKCIIEQFGLDIFEILRIDTYCDGLHPYDYETLFLQTNDCAKSDNWYNRHNNELIPFGSEAYNKLMFDLYGVYNNSYLEKTIKTRKNTMFEKYGKENYNNRERYKTTCLEKFSVENVFESNEIKEKSKISKFEKYGDEFYNNREKAKGTWLKNYGVNHPNKVMKICNFCGENHNIAHEPKCKLNPNRNVYNRNGSKNPKAKKFIILCPSGETITVIGEIKSFCENNGFSYGKLERGTVVGWKILEKI